MRNGPDHRSKSRHRHAAASRVRRAATPAATPCSRASASTAPCRSPESAIPSNPCVRATEPRCEAAVTPPAQATCPDDQRPRPASRSAVGFSASPYREHDAVADNAAFDGDVGQQPAAIRRRRRWRSGAGPASGRERPGPERRGWWDSRATSRFQGTTLQRAEILGSLALEELADRQFVGPFIPSSSRFQPSKPTRPESGKLRRSRSCLTGHAMFQCGRVAGGAIAGSQVIHGPPAPDSDPTSAW